MKKLLFASAVLLLLVACGGSEQSTDTPAPPTRTATLVPATDTPAPPTPTAAHVPATPTLAAQTLKDIDYFDGWLLDVYLPEGRSGAMPTILLVHGFGGGKGQYKWLAENLSSSGYAVVVPNWESSRVGVEEGLCSLAWTHANAETYGFDPERIAAFGHSAGSGLAALMAAIDDPTEFLRECPYELPESGALKGVVTYAGALFTPEWYLTTGKHLFRVYVLQGMGIPSDEGEDIRQALLDTPTERWRDIVGFSDKGMRLIHMLPPTWIDGSEPPFLLIHGGKDTVIDPLESEAFADLLRAAGVEVQVKIISSAHHLLGPGSPGLEETMNATQAFLAQILE